MSVLDNLRSMFSAFSYKTEKYTSREVMTGSHNAMNSLRFMTTTDAVVSKIYARIAVDVASASIRHVRLDEKGQYVKDEVSGLNTCLTLRPNIDQTPQQVIRELVFNCCADGVSALVPVDTDRNIWESTSFDIRSMRVGRVTEWQPRTVTVEVYNDQTGRRERVTLPKTAVAIIHNPFYSIMNEPNSDLRRLIEKLALLDKIDASSGNTKLDLIIQLPYEVRNERNEAKAKERIKSIDEQLASSSHGIAYAGANERITQLNRPVTNNLFDQIVYLTNSLYASLGISEAVFNGSAPEPEMLNYYTRTINPFLDEISRVLSWAFLTPTARTQGQSIRWFRSPLNLVPMSSIADIASSLITSEVMSNNEVRGFLGLPASQDPNADTLRNPNVNPAQSMDPSTTPVGNQTLQQLTEENV